MRAEKRRQSPHLWLLRLLLERAALGGVTLVRNEASGQLVPVESEHQLFGLELLSPGSTSSAIHGLEVAGLVARNSPGRWHWRVTPQGRQFLQEAAPGPFSAASLQNIPQYRDYWADVEAKNRRREFMYRRVEHYAAGRLLATRQLFRASAIEMGYAIEFHLKAALGEVALEKKDEDEVLRRHNLPKLFLLCREYGALELARVSTDFLCYARDHFESRYPRGQRALLEQEKYMSFGTDSLHVYDDCIVQLDLALAEDYGTTDYLIGKGALYESPIKSDLAGLVFFENVFAFEKLQEYLAKPSWALGSKDLADPSELFGKGPIDDWRRRVGADQLLHARLAEHYRYPQRGEPDPNPACRIPSLRRRIPFEIPEWIVKRAIERFGSENIDTGEEGSGARKQAHLLVFDRGAKTWWARLDVLKTGTERWENSPRARAKLDRWFSEVEVTFTERWNGELPGSRMQSRKPSEQSLDWARRRRARKSHG